jgi:hypothetical protein
MNPPAILLFACLTLLAPSLSHAEDDAVPLTATDVKVRWHDRLEGRRFTATVELRMRVGALEETRELVVFRDDEGARRERVMVRFHLPVDLRHTTFLYLERPGLPNDYFMYQPATRRVRRLPESVAEQDFYGIDLEFLGFGVSEVTPTEILETRVETLRGRRVHRLRERALEPNPRFEERITWLDAESFVPLRTEHHRDGRQLLLADTLEVADHQGVPTPVHVEFQRGDRRQVDLHVLRVDYQAPIPDEYFSVMELAKTRAR